MSKLISIVVPCFNEEESIFKLYDSLSNILQEIQPYDAEIIFVNDGSTDNTLSLMKELYKKDKRVKVISFSRNFGQQIAFTAGIDYAKGDAVILMDADLQDPPEVILDMIKKWENGYDVVYGLRRTRNEDSQFKKITAYLFYKFISKISKVNIPQNVGDFRLIDSKVVQVIRQFNERNRFLRGLISYIGFKQTYVEFDRPAGTRLTSHYTLGKMLRLASNAIIGFSNFWINLVFLCLTFLAVLSICFFVFSMFTLLFDSFLKITMIVIVAYLTVLSLSISFSLGVIIFYLFNVFDEVRKRPLYIISEILN